MEPSSYIMKCMAFMGLLQCLKVVELLSQRELFSYEGTLSKPYFIMCTHPSIALCLLCLTVSMVIADNTFEVKLQRGSSGLGLSVTGGRDAGPDLLACVLRIKQVFPGGAAAETGEIEEGDVLLEVDGQSLQHMSQSVSNWMVEGVTGCKRPVQSRCHGELSVSRGCY